MEAPNSWEGHRTEPPVRFVPRRIQFLGYDLVETGRGRPARLRAYRRKHGLTFAELAAWVGLDRETVAEVERGAAQGEAADA